MPAAADGEDIAKVVAGLAVLGILANSIDDRNDRQARSSQRIYRQDQAFNTRRDAPVIRGEIRHPNQKKWNSAKTAKYKRRPLPDRCLRIIDTHRRDRLAYSPQCLKRSYKFANRLPRDCKQLVRTNRGVRAVYMARCLQRDGWRVARR